MYSPEHKIRLRSSSHTDQGRVRQNNEDNVYLWRNGNHILAAVADGMGGAVAGEEASRIAVETIHKHLKTELYPQPDSYHAMDRYDLLDLLEETVHHANENILQRAREMPELKGMGTTITMAFIRLTDIVLAHVGDSRAYLVDGHDGSISQVTTDHSFVQALVDAGHITPEEADHHPMKNVLYRALGQSEELDVDILQDVHLHLEDRLILCSDGLTLHLEPDEIADIAMESMDPDEICNRLVDTANERGGRDNISVVVVVAERDGSPGKRESETSIEQMEQEDDDPTVPINRIYSSRSSSASSSHTHTVDNHLITHSHDTQHHNASWDNYGEGDDIMKPWQ